MNARKKLIEVALPLQAINDASAREKSIRHGHPSTLHLWWARRPLAAARAIIFAQMVDDPSSYPDLFPTEKKQERERQRLFKIIEDLVQWENTTNEQVLQAARDEIWQSWRRACADNADHPRAKELFNRKKLPAFHDPFAGGGALPLEAQRLGLEAHASDLNPVAVLINKAMVEIPSKFVGQPPINPNARNSKELIGREWRGAEGLADDVRFYGQWMRNEAEKRIGHLYPKIEITMAMASERRDLTTLVGQKLTVIAWLWARTVRSPNPALQGIDVPLVSNFMLAAKVGAEAYVVPIVEGENYRFEVRTGKPPDSKAVLAGTKLGDRGAAFRCILSGSPIDADYIKAEGKSGRMGAKLLAIVAEGERGRVYLSPTKEHETAAADARPNWKPEGDIPTRMTGGNCTPYGLVTWGDLFTSRQLVALTTLSSLVQEARTLVISDAMESDLLKQEKGEENEKALSYADGISAFLGLMVSRSADRHNTICSWDMGPTTSKSSTGSPSRSPSIRNAFSRQALPMSWDYAEGNPFSESATNFLDSSNWIAKVLEKLRPAANGDARQQDAAKTEVRDALISTDPPYYDNIGYADLSDFFYVWLRRALREVFPQLFATVAVPKTEELVATVSRHGSKEQAERFFLDGMTRVMHRLSNQGHPAFPVTVYYAFKQSESQSDAGTASTGWETFLEAVIKAGFDVRGTWPIRTELSNRMVGSGANALASSIVLVCRQRAADAVAATRREFVTALQRELPDALRHLQAGNIAPVDLAQAAIGPGMAVFTRYAKVLDAQGNSLLVREALALINETLDSALAEQEGDFDADSRWALAWFEQNGFAEGEYGVAETLSKAKNTSVRGLEEAGILESKRGRVRLFKPEEMEDDWDPMTDTRLTHWETVHHLIRTLNSGGESAAAALVSKLGLKAETARELAYRLYTVCERKKRATEALAYNGLVQSWPELVRLANESGERNPAAAQADLFRNE